MEIHVYEQFLTDANARLKAARIRVTIRCRGEALYLRATLPPKPGSRRVKPGQYDLKTGLPLSRDGLRRAEAEAQHLGSLLALKQFDWSDWLDEEPPEERAIREWIREFKQHYMSTHSLSEMTWKRHWQTVYDNLPQDGLLVAEALVVIALDTPPNTRKRREYCLKLQKLADFAEIELNLKPYRGNYSSTKPQNVRKLPTDEMLGEWLAKITNPTWRSFYGIVATFGLRPHEFWFCHFIDELTIQVTEGKTGERQVQALYPEWVERWELRDIQRPNVTAKVYRDYGDRDKPNSGDMVYRLVPMICATRGLFEPALPLDCQIPLRQE